MNRFCILLSTFGLIFLTSCGGGGTTGTSSSSSSSPSSQSAGSVVGNWQFTMAAPADGSFAGGIQGGFLLQDKETITGSAAYAIVPSGSQNTCNSGSAVINGQMNGQAVNLTATAGGQVFTLTGTLSADGSKMTGTYASTAGTTTTGGACGSVQAGLQWSARLIPALAGNVQGVFHSTGSGLLQGQSIPVSGIFYQGDNIGASSVDVTGTLTFQGYPCLGPSHQSVAVTGAITGDSVVLQLISDSGVNIGRIGVLPFSTSTAPANLQSLGTAGNALQGTSAYVVTTKSCPTGDTGNVCLALANGTACTQPITFFSTEVPPPSSVPSDYIQPPLTAVNFPPLLVGQGPLSQSIKLTNNDPSGSTLKGLTLTWTPAAGYTIPFSGFSDFNGQANFTEQDTCANAPGLAFDLAPQQSCTITFSFAPQQSCTWIPTSNGGATGVAPAQCPPFLGSSVPVPPALAGRLTVSSPKSVDSNTNFVIPVTGLGLSAVVPSTPELDFGSVAKSASSVSQPLTFSNQGTSPIQILPAASSPCTGSVTIPQPVMTGDVSGIQIVQGVPGPLGTTLAGGYHTVGYACDADLLSSQPNFQITSDNCTGKLLAPQDTCAMNISYVPQPGTDATDGLDYFLELNTQQCGAGSSQNCEIDSGRFPVELKANPTSPLRMSPGAGLDFGYQLKGTSSAPQTVTLLNDPNDPRAGTVEFKGNVLKGDYAETDTCSGSLAPGNSCTLTVVFTPPSAGFDPGTLTISYYVSTFIGPQTQTIYLRGSGQ